MDLTPESTVKRTTIVETCFTITEAQIRAAFNLPADATLWVSVPGGGDWSNTDLDLRDHPIRGRMVETETEEG